MSDDLASMSPEVLAALEYARAYYTGDEEVIEDYMLLSRYRPEVFAGYIQLRRAAFNTDVNAALSPKVKELVILAIEMARTKVNGPPVGHAKWALEAGATAAELAEVTSLCIMVGGMLTYQESGRFVLREAEHLQARRE